MASLNCRMFWGSSPDPKEVWISKKIDGCNEVTQYVQISWCHFVDDNELRARLSKLDMQDINFKQQHNCEFYYQLFNSEGGRGQSIRQQNMICHFVILEVFWQLFLFELRRSALFKWRRLRVVLSGAKCIGLLTRKAST